MRYRAMVLTRDHWQFPILAKCRRYRGGEAQNQNNATLQKTEMGIKRPIS